MKHTAAPQLGECTTARHGKNDDSAGYSELKVKPSASLHVCARVCKLAFDRDGDTSSSAYPTARRTERSSRGDTRIVGSGTYRRKARLDGRHTSVGGRAVAAVQFNQSRHITMGNTRFFPRLEGQHIGTAR
jgi:hypothetical protein